MSALDQYGVLLNLSIGTVVFILFLYGTSYVIGKFHQEPAKNVPATAGQLAHKPVWVRYHARYYGYALLFLAFDMEMAYMYPWAVVYKQVGITALLDMGVFLAILFLGLLYGWSQDAFRRQ